MFRGGKSSGNEESGNGKGGGGSGGGGIAGVDYNRIKAAVRSEQELMKLLLELPEQRFSELMQASQNAANAVNQMRDADQQKANSEAKKAHEERLKAEEEEKTKRQKQQLDAQKELEKIRHDQRIAESEEKTKREKELVDYRIKQELDAEAEKQRRKVEARKQIESLDAEKLAREEAHREAEHQRAMELTRLQSVEREKAKRETELSLADFRLEQRIREDQAFGEQRRKQDLEKHRMSVEGDIQKDKARWEAVLDFTAGEKGRDRLTNAFFFGAGLIGVAYGLHTVYPLAREGLRNLFFKPRLVSESFKNTMWFKFKSTMHNMLPSKSWHQKNPSLILSPQLEEQLNRVALGTLNTSKRGGLQSNLLLYGPPGTGKTMFARQLALNSKMDFAMMSGPSFDQFEPNEAIQEVKKLFRWARQSKRGLLLFVDEADSFLENRLTLPAKRIPVLNEWLSQTGTESRHFMCVYCTNRDEVLDPAIRSRITRSIEVSAPSERELKTMLEHYIKLYVVEELSSFREVLSGTGQAADEASKTLLAHLDLDEMSHQMFKHGFVGRDVTNYAIAVAQALYANSEFMLTKQLAWSVAEEQMKKKERESRHQRLKWSPSHIAADAPAM